MMTLSDIPECDRQIVKSTARLIVQVLGGEPMHYEEDLDFVHKQLILFANVYGQNDTNAVSARGQFDITNRDRRAAEGDDRQLRVRC